MNSIIKISSKADRNKPKDPTATEDVAANQRGANMLSRFGVATKSQFTCFFRGAKGETGGKAQSDLVESYVKNFNKRECPKMSDIVTDQVNEQDVGKYISVERFKADAEKKKLEANLNKKTSTLITSNQVAENVKNELENEAEVPK